MITAKDKQGGACSLFNDKESQKYKFPLCSLIWYCHTAYHITSINPCKFIAIRTIKIVGYVLLQAIGIFQLVESVTLGRYIRDK